MRLVLEHIEAGTAELSLAQGIDQRRLVDDRPARDIDAEYPSGPKASRTSRSTRRREVGPPAAATTRMSLSPARATQRRLEAIGQVVEATLVRIGDRHVEAARPVWRLPARSARARGCRAACPRTSSPAEWPTLPQLPARTRRSPTQTRRSVASISANARSATSSVSTSGVLVTRIPRACGMLEIHRIRDPHR